MRSSLVLVAKRRRFLLPCSLSHLGTREKIFSSPRRLTPRKNLHRGAWRHSTLREMVLSNHLGFQKGNWDPKGGQQKALWCIARPALETRSPDSLAQWVVPYLESEMLIATHFCVLQLFSWKHPDFGQWAHNQNLLTYYAFWHIVSSQPTIGPLSFQRNEEKRSYTPPCSHEVI